jgi:regulator of replication initiation timing
MHQVQNGPVGVWEGQEGFVKDSASPGWKWDTSGENMRRVRVGETISYSGYPYSDANRNDEETLAQENERLEAEVERLRSKLSAGVQAALSENEKLEAEVERLREALGFYANEYNHTEIIWGATAVDKDGGRKAREALAARERERGN